MTAARRPGLPVDVFADLTADTPAGPVAITGNGRTVQILFDNNDTFRRIVAPLLTAPRPARRDHLARVADLFAATDTEVIFRVESREVARVLGGRRDRLSSRILGLPGIRVRLISLFGALVRRPGARR